jgi:hypothetical protein
MRGAIREDSTRDGRRIWKLVEKVAAAAPKAAALQSDHLEIGESESKASKKNVQKSAKRRRAR